MPSAMVHGRYNKQISEFINAQFADLENPWTFHSLFSQPDAVVHEWMRKRGLLPLESGQLFCPFCEASLKLKIGREL